MNALPPAFLLCSPGSGSNYVCALLSRHLALCVAPGLNLLRYATISDLLNDYRRGAAGSDGLLRFIAQLYSGEQTVESVDMAKRWLVRRKTMESENVMVELCEKAFPDRLIDRWLFSADQSATLQVAASAFPGAKFLHLTRNPLRQGVAALQDLGNIASLWSEQSLAASRRRVALDPQHSWFETQRAIGEFGRSLDVIRFMHIRVEEIAARPLDCLKQIGEWFESRQPSAAEREWPFGGPGPYNAPRGHEWEEDPPGEEEASLEDAVPWLDEKAGLAPDVKALARELGY